MITEKITVVCLPTFNEAENIKHIVSSIFQFLPQAHILIIDDASPDGTGQLAEQLALKESRITVIHRLQKKGLGNAYMHGFKIALETMKPTHIIQMDADFSHSPKALPRMMDAAETADLVIGSRYIPGGGTKNWNVIRRMISRFGALYARSWLSLGVRDPTGGFKVWRMDLLKKVMAYSIRCNGYGFQVETTYIAARLNACIVEIPIVFADRRVGQSKMRPSIAIEAFWRIPLMRINHYPAIKKKVG